MGLLNGGSSREFVFSNFVNSTEFANICVKYGIQAGILTVENTGTAATTTTAKTTIEKTTDETISETTGVPTETTIQDSNRQRK